MKLFYRLISVCLLAIPCYSFAQTHPNLMLTAGNIAAVRSGCANSPLLKKSYLEIKAKADKALAEKMDVPTPKDGAGGYTHEQHKNNSQNILACGIAYQISGDPKYAAYIKTMLLQYAAQYEQWPQHPKRKSNQIPGKMFWQCLNDFVWQVTVIQGYDMVYNAIPAKDRVTIEQHLFIPIVKYFTTECKETFDLIHNHGTWCLAAVGMTGYVIHNPEYVEMALKGSAKDGKTGFLKQLDELFSPDGYYTEGPYYQRYAIMPFIAFAKAIQQNQPQLHIFQYRNNILAKAIHAALQTTYTTGNFFPVNDAMKDKDFSSEEIVYGIDVAYADIQPEADLLDIAKRQGHVVVSDAGLKVSKAIDKGLSKPFGYKSMFLSDGPRGDEGGLGILRYGSNASQQCVLLKAAAQGMGHGHFDRLNLLYYDNNTEVFSDYGSARFINIESKFGGDYLPENKTWAKQTIAHNTVTVDQTSQYKANLEKSEAAHASLVHFEDKSNIQVVSGREDGAYPGVGLLRSSILFKPEELKKALLIDVFEVNSEADHQYSLPFWYQGVITDASFKFSAVTDGLKAMGKDNGFQHIWLNSNNDLAEPSGFITMLNNNIFYTTHFAATSPLQVKLVTLGAGDPNMNLRNERGFILEQHKNGCQAFISITETHGKTDPTSETTSGAQSNIGDIKVMSNDVNGATFSFTVKGVSYTAKLDYNSKNNFIQISKSK
ncbi:heparinase [Mucilaginibacter sp. PPCGB 2223]|uniref:alginate lyase family protein n=1 Tax=Mucilaginibacter sp. PPCGB 2223 TaxID=1886027 RepID=UPI00082692C5|nr:alginate lyase family protein [Mucilaginibacter sp. PPCGB 2223]OCX54419.1 heparinase [Mucilaginibacter sp. PPCGB 2223]